MNYYACQILSLQSDFLFYNLAINKITLDIKRDYCKVVNLQIILGCTSWGECSA